MVVDALVGNDSPSASAYSTSSSSLYISAILTSGTREHRVHRECVAALTLFNGSFSCSTTSTDEPSRCAGEGRGKWPQGATWYHCRHPPVAQRATTPAPDHGSPHKGGSLASPWRSRRSGPREQGKHPPADIAPWSNGGTHAHRRVYHSQVIGRSRGC